LKGETKERMLKIISVGSVSRVDMVTALLVVRAQLGVEL
jgi:hypothetical protein